MNTLELLIKNLSKLPGLGRKSAARIAYHLIKQDNSFLEALASQIKELKEKMITCSQCRNFTEEDPCEICCDTARDHQTVCVVEQSQDVQTIESTNEYSGVYYVLHGAISPIDGIGPQELKLDAFVSHVLSTSVREVIVATNPNVEGDTTALYIVKLLKDTGVKVTRLAAGLPIGGDLEYAGRLTIARSLKGRTELEH